MDVRSTIKVLRSGGDRAALELFRAEANGRDEVQLFLTRLAETLRSARYPQVQVLGPISGWQLQAQVKLRADHQRQMADQHQSVF